MTSPKRSSNIGMTSPRRANKLGMTSSGRTSCFGTPSPVRGSKRRSKAVSHWKTIKRSLQVDSNSGEIGSQKAVPEGLEIYLDRCNTIEKTAVQNIKRVEQNHAAVTVDIIKFRQQLNKALDLWEREVLAKVDVIMHVDIAHLKSVIEENTKLVNDMQELAEVSEYQTKLYEINVIETETKNIYREYKFISNDNISNLLKTEPNIGDINITQDVAGLYSNLNCSDNIVPTYLADINVKADNDVFDCDVTGMVMIGSRKLVVADTDNRSVKCLDTKLNRITSQLVFSSGPWDLTVVHRGQLAITLPSERLIQFVLTSGGLTKDRHMKVSGECHGIAYRRGCLIVSFRSPGKVQLMNLQGRVLKSIKHDAHQNKLFHWPDYVAVSRDGNSIYVSDWQRNAVTCLSWKGEVTGVYKDGVGTKMAGIAIADDDSVYVCKRTSHSIVRLTPDCSVGKLILEEKHGLKYPWSICFCDEERRLYVDNNRNSNTIAVFELR